MTMNEATGATAMPPRWGAGWGRIDRGDTTPRD